MATPNAAGKPPATADRRTLTPTGRAILAGMQVRDEDVASASGGRAAVTLFRVLSGVALVLLVVQVMNDLSGVDAVPFGALIARAGRPAIAAGVLWGAGQLAALLSTVQQDLRATRILLARMARLAGTPVEADGRSGDAPR